MQQSALIAGFRQGLTQVAQNLRRQTAAWRAEAEQAAKNVSLQDRLLGRDKAALAEVARWCGRVDQIAASLELEAQKRLTEEHAAVQAEAGEIVSARGKRAPKPAAKPAPKKSKR